MLLHTRQVQEVEIVRASVTATVGREREKTDKWICLRAAGDYLSLVKLSAKVRTINYTVSVHLSKINVLLMSRSVKKKCTFMSQVFALCNLIHISMDVSTVICWAAGESIQRSKRWDGQLKNRRGERDEERPRVWCVRRKSHQMIVLALCNMHHCSSSLSSLTQFTWAGKFMKEGRKSAPSVREGAEVNTCSQMSLAICVHHA